MQKYKSKLLTGLLSLFAVIGIGSKVEAQQFVDRSYVKSYQQYPYKIETQIDSKKKTEWNRTLTLGADLKAQSSIYMEGWRYTKVKIGDNAEAILYTDKSKIQLSFPEQGADREISFFKEGEDIAISMPTYEELQVYRNIALNPYDFGSDGSDKSDDLQSYPHITASSECRNMAQFAARNCVDGVKNNLEHGAWHERSWGPELEESAWLEIDFGRAVEIDNIKLLIRADFPHDSYWNSARIIFDSGESKDIKITDSSDMQSFSFTPQVSRKVRIEQFKAVDSSKYSAITEIEVWGRDQLPVTIGSSWRETVESFKWVESSTEDSGLYINALQSIFPLETDWLINDFGVDIVSFIKSGDIDKRFLDKAKELAKAHNISLGTGGGVDRYLSVHNRVRANKLQVLEQKSGQYVYVKRHRYMPSFFAYTEGLSDARSEFSYTPGGSLVVMNLKDGVITEDVIIEESKGVVRDPDVSYDGKRILFSWKKSMREDDFHLYEYDTETKKIRQITEGLGHADIEGKYLPNGEIVFNSTRCGQSVDCWKTEVSNLYFVREDGKYMRRVGYDQVHTTYPTVTDQGTIIYTRWDYNDRGQTFPQPLFSMNMDGTMQRELYGNSSWYPTTMTHARQIPGTSQYMVTLCGHHTSQKGKLAVIDPSRGRQGNSGVTLLAPKRVEDAVRIDQYGQHGEQFQYPYPFSEEQFLVSYDPINSVGTQFGLYFMDSSGERELLTSDSSFDCKQIVPLAPRKRPQIRPNSVDYTRDSGVFYVQDVYYGEAVKGLERGSIERLRVVELDFRSATVGGNQGHGNEGGVGVANLAATPIALAMGAWDVKRVLGEVVVEKDGSAMFEVPAHTPLYFQLIDKSGNVAQTMRSWSTLQPGETFGCVGCHEDKNESVPLKGRSIAMRKRVQKIKPLHGMSGGFSYPKEIQPILDKHCIVCHYDRDAKRLLEKSLAVSGITATQDSLIDNNVKRDSSNKAFSLLDHPVISSKAKRVWSDSYMNLLSAKERQGTYQGDYTNRLINWPGMQSVPTLLPIYFRGAATSSLMKMLNSGHGNTELSKEEIEKIACWIDLQVPYCGDYYEANIWSDDDKAYYNYYQTKRDRAAELDKQNIDEYLQQL